MFVASTIAGGSKDAHADYCKQSKVIINFMISYNMPCNLEAGYLDLASYMQSKYGEVEPLFHWPSLQRIKSNPLTSIIILILCTTKIKGNLWQKIVLGN